MRYLVDRIRSLAGRRGALHVAVVALAAAVTACAPPAVVAGSDGTIEALRAPTSAVESLATGDEERRAGGTARPVADAHGAPTDAHRGDAVTAQLPGSAWRGEYAAKGQARRAALALTLRTGDGHGPDALTGELALWVVRAADAFDDVDDASRATLVRVPLARASHAGGDVRLVTEPFLDPACGCTVTGTFTGTVRGDAIDGRFALRGAATTASHRGRWRAERLPEGLVQGSATSPDE